MSSISYIVILIFFVLSTLAGYLVYKKFSRSAVRQKDIVFLCLNPTEDKAEAGEQVLAYLNEEFKTSGREVAVYEGVECADDSGWLFFWDAAAFIIAKNQDAAFKGSNPIYFNKKTGEISYIQSQLVGQYIGRAKP
ncbi:MAG: hypothetical protein IMF07_03945 [Proteobacteria bacterium]|nr:hypothetical protein [Pseudomonadota bacterium]